MTALIAFSIVTAAESKLVADVREIFAVVILVASIVSVRVPLSNLSSERVSVAREPERRNAAMAVEL